MRQPDADPHRSARRPQCQRQRAELLEPLSLAALPQLLGCDFSSSPSRRKPVVMALGRLDGDVVHLAGLERFEGLAELGARLAAPGHWVGGFDQPFGLPRAFVQAQGWPTDWAACMDRYAAHTRAELRALFQRFCAARPVGHKFAHRATDGPAGASPSMKWVNPPVAWMMHAGVPLLREAGVSMPGLGAGDPHRVALEAYPGLWARAALGGRRSYKSDDRQRQTPERRQARGDLVDALRATCASWPWGLRLGVTRAQRELLIDDAGGDLLDAVICMLQAAWGLRQHLQGAPLYGLPAAMDPLEGWIVSAPWR